MKTKYIALLFVSLSSVVSLSACTNTVTDNSVYSTAHTGVMQDVQFGEVLGVRNIIIQQNSSETGQTAGGIIGAVAGSEAGKGKGKIVGSVVGAVAGGAIGGLIDRNVQARPGIEMTLKLDSGRTVAIVQLAGEVFLPGERVKVLTARDGRARVTH